MTRDQFLEVWVTYDDACARISARRLGRDAGGLILKAEAEAMENACIVYAPTLGLTVSAFRGLLDAWRRAELDHDGALRAVEVAVADRRTLA